MVWGYFFARILEDKYENYIIFSSFLILKLLFKIVVVNNNASR